MRTKILLTFIMAFFAFQSPKAEETDIIDDIAGYFRTSNTRELSKYFASTVELIILSEEDVYSKVQAEIILKDFLSKHQPSFVKIVHRLNSNPNYRFGVALMNTDNGNFRISFSMKYTAGKFLITEIRIEYNKD